VWLAIEPRRESGISLIFLALLPELVGSVRDEPSEKKISPGLPDRAVIGFGGRDRAGRQGQITYGTDCWFGGLRATRQIEGDFAW
jgi:hypothetical protein